MSTDQQQAAELLTARIPYVTAHALLVEAGLKPDTVTKRLTRGGQLREDEAAAVLKTFRQDVGKYL